MSTGNLQKTLFAAMRAQQAQRTDEAERLAQSVLASHPENPRAAEIIGQIRLRAGRNREAAEYFSTALRAAPNDADLLNLMGAAVAADRKYRAALPYFQQAVQVAPDDAPSWENLGKAAYQARRWSHARAAFEHCLGLMPDNDEAAAGLARLDLRDGNVTAAIALAAAVIGRNPHHLLGRQVLAEAHLRQGEFEQAILRSLEIVEMPHASAKHKVLAYGMAADATDALGRFDEAFSFYAAMNDAVAEAYAVGYKRAQVRKGYEQLREITKLTPQLAEASKNWPREPAIPATAYYIGFVSSGMSALTRIMLRHPQLVSGKDRRQVRSWEEIVWAPDANQRVAALNASDMRNLRAEFGETLVQAGIDLRNGKMMFDQRPFYTRHLMTLAAILPEAKFILAHRDPRDVVLSCYRHRSSPNVSMYEFLNLETAAHYYDASMEAMARAREAFDIDLIELGDVQFWADPEGETRRVLDHIGLPWDNALLGADGDIVAGLRQAPSEWRKYEAQLAPVMPLLDKWVKYFGYD